MSKVPYNIESAFIFSKSVASWSLNTQFLKSKADASSLSSSQHSTFKYWLSIRKENLSPLLVSMIKLSILI